MKHFFHVDSGETLNLSVHAGRRIEFLAHIDVLLVLLEEVLQIQLAIGSRADYRSLLII